jgi:hypothetical protein
VLMMRSVLSACATRYLHTHGVHKVSSCSCGLSHGTHVVHDQADCCMRTLDVHGDTPSVQHLKYAGQWLCPQGWTGCTDSLSSHRCHHSCPYGLYVLRRGKHMITCALCKRAHNLKLCLLT